MSLKIKTFFAILIAILIPAVFSNLFIYAQSENSIVNQTAISADIGMTKSIELFDSNLNALVSISKKIQNDSDLIELIQLSDSVSKKDKNGLYAEIYSKLNLHLQSIEAPNITKEIDSLYLYLDDANAVVTTSSTYYEDIDKNNVSYLNKGSEYANKWYDSTPIDFYSLQGKALEERLLSYSHHIYDNSGNPIGICALNLNSNVFNTVYNGLIQSVPEGIIVYDESGKVLSSMNLSSFNSENLLSIEKSIAKNYESGKNSYFVTNEADDEYLIVPSVSKQTGWTYTSVIRTEDFLSGLYETKKLLALIIVLMIIAVPIISIIIAQSIFRPTQTLASAMQKIQNRDLTVVIDEKRNDEYQKLFDGFNDMVFELNELIKDLTNEKILNKEAKIRLLQEQINPHFLYNTLDSTYSLAQLHDVPAISEMIFALSRFFRVSLSEGKKFVALKEALQIVESFMTVQNIRFDGRFKFMVSIPDDLMTSKVLKLVLQPLVENAIYHGFENKKTNNIISITGEEKNNKLLLCVNDNGAGMSSEKLKEIRNVLENSNMEESSNFAIKNLNTQIKLIYGEEYGIEINSEFNIGTSIYVKLPLIY